MLALPSHLVKLRILAEVPRSEYLGLTPDVSFVDANVRQGFFAMLRQKKSAPIKVKLKTLKQIGSFEFNAAIWLTFPCPPIYPVSLWLSYKDSGGKKSVLVDEQHLEFATSTMLSGNVQLDVNGELEYLKACCGGVRDDEIFSIDELHVQLVPEDESLPDSLGIG